MRGSVQLSIIAIEQHRSDRSNLNVPLEPCYICHKSKYVGTFYVGVKSYNCATSVS